jgi:hypothetical protein
MSLEDRKKQLEQKFKRVNQKDWEALNRRTALERSRLLLEYIQKVGDRGKPLEVWSLAAEVWFDHLDQQEQKRLIGWAKT